MKKQKIEINKRDIKILESVNLANSVYASRGENLTFVQKYPTEPYLAFLSYNFLPFVSRPLIKRLREGLTAFTVPLILKPHYPRPKPRLLDLFATQKDPIYE